MKFLKNVPLAAKRELTKREPQFSDAETKRIVTALASDERMESVWGAIQHWNDSQIESFTSDATVLAMPEVVSELTLPPEYRYNLNSANHALRITAEQFAEANRRNCRPSRTSAPRGAMLRFATASITLSPCSKAGACCGATPANLLRRRKERHGHANR
jgi:hypothetical protein